MAKKKSPRSRHLARIRRQIRRMESRGYVFDEEFKAGLSQRSTRSLAQIKTKGLYKRAKAQIVDTETGEIKTISGLELRDIERSESAKRAAITRKQRKAVQPESSYENYDNDAPDHADYPFLSDENYDNDYDVPDYADYPDVSDEIIDNLDALLFKLGQPVSDMAVTAKDGRYFLKPSALRKYSQNAKNQLQRLLDREVARSGEEEVAKRIYSKSDEIDVIIGIVEYSAYDGRIADAVQEFESIITGIDRADLPTSLADTFGEEYESWEEV